MMGSMPNAPRTPIRTIRIADEVWIPAQAKAKREGRNVSEVVREFLTDYAGEDESS